MLHRTAEAMRDALLRGKAISIHHKPDSDKGGTIYEGCAADFKSLSLSDDVVTFEYLGVPHRFPIAEVASVGTL